MKKEQVEKWRDFLVGTAKKILLEKERLMPMVFILTKNMNIGEDVRRYLLNSETWSPVDEGIGKTPNDYALLIMPISYDDPEMLLGMLPFFAEDRSEVREFIKNTLEAGKRTTHPDPAGFLLQALMRQIGINTPKNLVASFLKMFIKEVEAEAWAKIDEIWFTSVTKEEHETHDEARQKKPADLRDDETAMEAIGLLIETKEMTMLSRMPIYRAQRDTGPVQDFGEMDSMVDDGTTNERLDGRFTHLLRERRA